MRQPKFRRHLSLPYCYTVLTVCVADGLALSNQHLSWAAKTKKVRRRKAAKKLSTSWKSNDFPNLGPRLCIGSASYSTILFHYRCLSPLVSAMDHAVAVAVPLKRKNKILRSTVILQTLFILLMFYDIPVKLTTLACKVRY